MFRSMVLVAAVLLSAGAFAGSASAQGMDSATLHGKDADMLAHFKNPQPYRVCHEEGNEQLSVTYDDQKVMIDSGDCVHVEAAKISAKGQSDNAVHRLRFGSVAGPRRQKWWTQGRGQRD